MIDDEPDVLAMLGLLMREWGCESLAAGSLAQARAQLRESGFVPDLLLVDFRLADGETGLAAIEALHTDLGPVSAIVVTGSSAPDELRMLEAAGFPILHKPVKPDELLAAIGRALPRHPALSG
jgi:CheY-like chemotaxis protein